MNEETLKQHLFRIANNLTSDSTLEDVYEQLSLLSDIDESEEQVKNKEIFSQSEVKELASQWLK